MLREKMRTMPVNPKVEKRLLGFLEKHPGAYTDQIARRLKLDVFDVHDALMELYRRGKVKPGHAC